MLKHMYSHSILVRIYIVDNVFWKEQPFKEQYLKYILNRKYDFIQLKFRGRC